MQTMERLVDKFAKAGRSETGHKCVDIESENSRLRKSQEDRIDLRERNRQGVEISRHESRNDFCRGSYIEKKIPCQTGVKWYRGMLVRKLRSSLSQWEVIIIFPVRVYFQHASYFR